MQITCCICSRRITWEENPYRPFCSAHCKTIDLGAWVSEDYRVEGNGEEEDDDDSDDESKPDD